MTPGRIRVLTDWANEIQRNRSQPFRKQSHEQLIKMRSYHDKVPNPNVQILYRLVGGFEHYLISRSDFQRIPLVDDTTTLWDAAGDDNAIRVGKALELAGDDDTVRYLLKTKFTKAFLTHFPETICGDKENIRREWRFWNPNYEALNRHIVGKISVIYMFPARRCKCLACGCKIYEAPKNIFYPFCDGYCQMNYDPHG